MIRIFRHFVPVQVVLLAAVEAAILIFSIYLAIALRFVGGDAADYLAVGPVAPRAILFAFVMLSTMTALGMFTRESQTGDSGYYIRFLASFLVGGVAMTFIFYLLPGLLLGRGVMGLAFLFAGIAAFVSLWHGRD